MDKKTISSADEMKSFAAKVVDGLAGGDTLLLSGELGAGKTTFVQGLAAALGIEQDITSPTFTIVGEYPVRNHQNITKLVHVDLYRLSEDAAGDPAVRQVVSEQGGDTLVAIEWAERLGNAVPSGTRIAFEHGANENARLVTLNDA